VPDTNERFSITFTKPGENAYFCVAINLSVGRPVHCYSLDERAFASSIPSVVQSIADGSLAYAEWTAPDGHFRIKRQ
jgi:hypothetical protein